MMDMDKSPPKSSVPQFEIEIADSADRFVVCNTILARFWITFIGIYTNGLSGTLSVLATGLKLIREKSLLFCGK